MSFKETLTKSRTTDEMLQMFRPLTRILFPRFNELQLLLLLAIGIIVPNSYVLSVIDGAFKTTETTILFVGACMIVLVLLFLIFRAKTLTLFQKVIICSIFYGFFAVCSYNALVTMNQHAPVSTSWLNSLNVLMIKAMLILSLIRGFTVYIILRTQTTSLNKWLTQNFSDEQMNFWQAVTCLIIAISVMSILQRLYIDNPSTTLVVLAYMYSLAIYKALYGVLSRVTVLK